ncbi:MAG: acetyl-CoA carboxylase carboxyltransferase subunit beta [Kiritimatiellaeota bacterium]|nr:acetyl-CoA carboxylase carboxyltransferase subunit beta [Kiritimatiellota bacterium]
MPIFKKQKYSTLRSVPKKKNIPQGLWEKCKKCGEVVFLKQIKENDNVCPKCSYHHPMTAYERVELLTDAGSFKEIDGSIESVDTLKFEGVASYSDKLEANKKKTGMNDAMLCGTGTLDGKMMALGVMDFRFLGASMGSALGEKVTRLTELATKKRLPLVIVTASGGARMYEGMLSLMQMAKTSGALERHGEAELPYIVIMTHPTTAGVTASFASLGDLTIAEPGALIGFAGPRVIKDTTQAVLPEGFQTSEFLMKKGMIDRIVERKDLRKELSLYLGYFKAPGVEKTKSSKKNVSTVSQKKTNTTRKPRASTRKKREKTAAPTR